MTKKLTIQETFEAVFQYCSFDDCEDDAAVKEIVKEAFTQGVADGYIKSFILLNAEFVGKSVFVKVLINETEKEYRMVFDANQGQIGEVV